MQAFIGFLRQFSFPVAMLRLLLAAACGGAVGYGRSKKDRPAGLRTYMLISIGAAIAVLLALYEYAMLTGPWSAVAKEVGMKFDASRLGAQVITGIGFLGAGIPAGERLDHRHRPVRHRMHGHRGGRGFL